MALQIGNLDLSRIHARNYRYFYLPLVKMTLGRRHGGELGRTLKDQQTVVLLVTNRHGGSWLLVLEKGRLRHDS